MDCAILAISCVIDIIQTGNEKFAYQATVFLRLVAKWQLEDFLNFDQVVV